MKARYSPQNAGHFGLAAKYYTHFTSPIRRYPDLAIHRILKEFIDGRLTSERAAHFRGFTVRTSEVSSEKEISAENAERDVDDLMKAVCMSQFIGQAFEATVSSVTNFGIFAELDNSVEGLIRLENLKDDYYVYDDKLRRLTGERTGQVYKIGDRINVTLVRTDTLSRQIDFILTKDAEHGIGNAIETVKKLRRGKDKKTVAVRRGVKKSRKKAVSGRKKKKH
jgi:ribonuclease R